MGEVELTQNVDRYRVVEICAGAGGQSLGLERAGFEHLLAVELDRYACATLRANRPVWEVAEGDVADSSVWTPEDFEGVDLLAGGVPCPPFSVAGKQLGASDERDLFAWAIELANRIRPRALMLENVRGLATPRFAGYRQRAIDRLTELGYRADWKLLQASNFGVPQLRPRFVLIALKTSDAEFFSWPEEQGTSLTVGDSLRDLMGENGWKYVDTWADIAKAVGPTLVGGSKKHGGADLGPTRAKRAWLNLGVDGRGIADGAPCKHAPHPLIKPPRLTIDMVAKLQGWKSGEWTFQGGKTARYRQIGNAFPPPVAEALGRSLISSFDRLTPKRDINVSILERRDDRVYRILKEQTSFNSSQEVLELLNHELNEAELMLSIEHLARDFELEIHHLGGVKVFRLGQFKGFLGQADHKRHLYLTQHRERIS